MDLKKAGLFQVSDWPQAAAVCLSSQDVLSQTDSNFAVLYYQLRLSIIFNILWLEGNYICACYHCTLEEWEAHMYTAVIYGSKSVLTTDPALRCFL